MSQRPRPDRLADRGEAPGQVVPVRVGTIPPVLLHGMGLLWPLMRELRETEYQFRDDFIMDSAAAQATFGLKPAPWERSSLERSAVAGGRASR